MPLLARGVRVMSNQDSPALRELANRILKLPYLDMVRFADKVSDNTADCQSIIVDALIDAAKELADA